MARKTTEKNRKVCTSCGKQKVLTNYYSTNSKMFSDGKVPICKPCIQDQIDENDTGSIKRILRQIDKPFIHNLWQDCLEDERETFGWYMRMINSLPQYKKMTYEDSVNPKENDSERSRSKTNDVEDIEEIKDDDGESIKITENIKAKFGSGYTNREYLQMEKFYQDMMRTHEINSPQHKEILIEMAQLNVEKKRLREEQNYADYKRLSDAYKDMMKDAGFRPADRVSGSEATGLRTFSQMFEEIEKDGFIEPTPIEVHEDVLDRMIIYMGNYTRRLLNMDIMTTPPEDFDEKVKGENNE